MDTELELEYHFFSAHARQVSEIARINNCEIYL